MNVNKIGPEVTAVYVCVHTPELGSTPRNTMTMRITMLNVVTKVLVIARLACVSVMLDTPDRDVADKCARMTARDMARVNSSTNSRLRL